ncbi:MAG: BREX system Lon protease-like protein BrxL [Nostoc sp.]|uniref:BREX system Lon protease-like protein BrxL n=1 Tax=Nostoc sp. TaxID=1180 RepID=UPI002FF8BD5D
MLLNQLVEINEKGSIASSVNFGILDDLEKNLPLCESFIFNYDLTKPELSTVGILDAVRRSYHSPNQPNIHLMIQQYGKGKSHFAIAVANFFKKPFHSQEVQGILSQVEKATSAKNQAISEGLKLFKQNQRHQHLVICLSGDQGGDIRKQFLQQLVKNVTIRDQNAILKSASGFLKILYPHLELTLMDYERDCLEPACKLRQAIRNSLYYLDDEFRQFGREIYVETK